jgi:exodeoxyribonuclease VII small subunit
MEKCRPVYNTTMKKSSIASARQTPQSTAANSPELDFAKAMQELEAINEWFQSDEIDLDKGLEKLKKGRELIAACKARLSTIENEVIQLEAVQESDSPNKNADATVVASISVTQFSPQASPDDDDLPF